jgi:hypothetical protein
MSINEQFIDVDFETDPFYTAGDLGLGAVTGLCANFGDSIEVMSDSEIDASIDAMDEAGGGADQLVTRIYNQGQEGSCVANAFSQANEIIQSLQYGRDKVVHLSAMSLYKRIGRSASSGAMVSDGIEEMSKRGILPLDDEANRAKYGSAVMPNTGWRTPFPSNWEATAKLFCGHEYFIVRNSRELFTALCRQYPVVVGRAGHSICYVRPMKQNGRRVVKYANSWGNWGDNGYGYDSQRLYDQSARWAVAVRSTVSRPKQPI